MLQASPEDISNAYRRLSRLYHPDKHMDSVLKKEAEILFNRTKKAYEGIIITNQYICTYSYQKNIDVFGIIVSSL